MIGKFIKSCKLNKDVNNSTFYHCLDERLNVDKAIGNPKIPDISHNSNKVLLMSSQNLFKFFISKLFA